MIPLGQVTRFDDAITFGRVLGYVWLDAAEGVPHAATKQDLSTIQIEAGHARRRKDELMRALGR